MPSCCEFSGSSPNRSTFTISAGSESRRTSLITVRVRVRGGAAHVAPESLSRVLDDLEVAMSATLSTLVRERNPAIGLVCHQSSGSYSITNRYIFGNSWLRSR
jgi:hypothetical protein